MKATSTDGRGLITRRHRNLLLVASVLTYLLVTLGGIVCVTDSSRGCPDWPACYGQLLPPMRIDSILEYAHRATAALTSVAIAASAVVGFRKPRSIRWVAWPPLVAIFLLLLVSAFGAMAVLRGLEPGLAALDLGSALGVLALMIAATMVAFAHHKKPTLPCRPSFHDSFARLALWALVGVFIVLVSGVLVATEGSPVRCLSWPLYGGNWPVAEGLAWLQWVRRLLAGVVGILLITMAVHAWHRPRAIRVTSIAVGASFVLETVIGALMALYGSPVSLQVAHTAMAAALWASLVVLTGLASLLPTHNTMS